MAFDYVARAYTVPAPEKPTYGESQTTSETPCGTGISLESIWVIYLLM